LVLWPGWSRAPVPANAVVRHIVTFGRVLREAVASRIGNPPRPPLLPPIGGALLAAAQHLDWQTQPAWIERLAASIQAAPTRDCKL